MKNTLLIGLFSLLISSTVAQRIYHQYTPPKDSLRIGYSKSDLLPFNDKGYTLILPETATQINGILISIEDDKFNLQDSSQQIHHHALAKNFAVLYISTGVPVDLFFSAASFKFVDTTIRKVFSNYKLPNKNIFFLGVSLAGHRALKYWDYCWQGKSVFKPNIMGFVLCEGVLDWVRMWYECKKGVRDNFAESSIFEGKLVTYLLEKNLRSTPKTNIEKYLDFSAYSYFDEENRHIKDLKFFAVRAYTEPATHYWMEEKRKTTYDTNFPDMVGIINELKLLGSTKAELIVFNQDKRNKDRRNPNYTWALVNKAELMDWIVANSK
jgi:hypothetical protein